MYVIEIAHPNDAVLNQWTVVDSVANRDELFDILRAPTFDVQEHLIVRTRGFHVLYHLAVYHQENWISLLANTQVPKLNRWDFNLDIENFSRDKNLIEQWTLCENAAAMLYYARNKTTRAHLVQAACACARTSVHMIPERYEKAIFALQKAEEWSLTQYSKSEVRWLAEEARRMTNEMATEVTPSVWAACDACTLAAECVNHDSKTKACGAATQTAMSYAYGHADPTRCADAQLLILADVVRKAIPFHEILASCLAKVIRPTS